MDDKFIPANVARDMIKKVTLKDDEAMRLLKARTLDDIEAAIKKEKYSCPFRHYAIEFEGRIYYKFWEMCNFLKEKGYRIEPIISEKSDSITASNNGLYDIIPCNYTLASSTANTTKIQKEFELKGFNICW